MSSYVYLDKKVEYKIIKEDQNSEVVSENQILNNQDENKKNNIDLRLHLVIDKIKMNKFVNQVMIKDIQSSIDKGLLATPSKPSDATIYIFAHYTNVNNVMFNQLPSLVIGDRISLINQNIKTEYQVEKFETIPKDELFEKHADLILITCTKNFDKNSYYCVYAKKLGE